MNNNYMYNYVKDMLYKNNIKIRNEKTCNYLTTCIENIIFNVVSIAAVITFINNCKIVKKECITIIKKYLNNMCGSPMYKTIKGGGGSIVLPSEFYGVNSMNYSPTNNLYPMDKLTIDFTNNIARPQIGGGYKNEKSSKSNAIYKGISDILVYYKLKATNETKIKICSLIECYIKCLMNKLKNIDKKISSEIIDETMKSSKVFDIFK